MVQYQDTYTPGMSRMQGWSTEITQPERRHPAMVGTEPGRKVGEMTGPAGMTGMTGMSGQNRNTAMKLFAQKNPQFAQFLRDNQGKSTQQIEQDYGLDWNMVQNLDCICWPVLRN